MSKFPISKIRSYIFIRLFGCFRLIGILSPSNVRLFVCSIVFLVFTSLAPLPSSATHIIGGELTYECILFNDTDSIGYYFFRMKLYRHCDQLTIHAEFDNIIYVALYDDNNNVVKKFNMQKPPTDTLENNTYNICLFSPPEVCAEGAIYEGYTFIKPGHYYVTYQRCCRNNAIENIVQPDAVGAGWYLNIPDPFAVGCNSSPVYKLYPPTIICVGEKFIYDHSATDKDGDSLVYSLCPASDFNASLYGASPDPARPPGDLFNVPYITGYTYLHPFGPNDSMQIDSQTGLLSFYPSVIGQYVVAVCVSEYRNGTLLSTNKRDFQFNVAPCLEKVKAGFNYQITDCDVNKVKFFSDPDNYATFNWWDFGIDSISSDSSILQDPVYSYPAIDTVYFTTQIVNKGYSCADTIVLPVTIPTKLEARFMYTEECVFDTTLFFENSKTNTYTGTVNKWNWNFGDGTSSNIKNPGHVFNDTLDKYVKLIVITNKNCSDTVSRTVSSYPLPVVSAGTDIWLTRGYSAMLNATGTFSYLWSPGKFLSDSTIPNPAAAPVNTTDYFVTGFSSKGCRDTDTVIVNVLDPKITLPNAFTPNNDGKNDTLFLLHIGIKTLIDFKIFNRWGEIVFESFDLKKGWDGNYKNEPQEIGTYVYYYKAESITGTFVSDKGNVALLR